jgi:choline dehydrogenase-like flavoprotein
MDTTPQKYITLADATDAHGDPFARVHHELSDFDYETFTRQHRWTVDIAQHLDAEITHDVPAQTWGSGHHHMGGCRMSENPADGVLNPYGEVHHCKNLYVLGSATFPGTMAVNPTLTLLAMTLRTLDYIVDQD